MSTITKIQQNKNTGRDRKFEMLSYAMGKDILDFMQDKKVFEVMVNPDGKLWVDTFDRGRVFSGVIIPPETSRQIILAVAALADQVIDRNEPAISAEIPDSLLFDSARFQGELPFIVEAPAFNIRKHPKIVLSLDDYVAQGTMTQQQKSVIIQCIHDKKNIIAAGGTKSGKTTLLNAILQEISKSPERVVLIEDTPELRCTAEDCVSLRTMPHVDMSMLLRYTLRKSPDRIVVGEVRGGEALALVDAWSTGHSGGCSTLHSNSAADTLVRLENLVSRSAVNPQEMTIANAVNVIIYLKYIHQVRRITEIISVDGYDAVQKKYLTHVLVPNVDINEAGNTHS